MLVILFLAGSLLAAPAWSQTTDIASERSRVANERIRIEAERMAQKEERRAEATAEAGCLERSRMLEHLNVLGQLRDSGYVTEAEFERIKQRILDGEL